MRWGSGERPTMVRPTMVLVRPAVIAAEEARIGRRSHLELGNTATRR